MGAILSELQIGAVDDTITGLSVEDISATRAGQQIVIDSLRAQLASAQRRIAALGDELRLLKGEHDKTPLTGCQIVNVPYKCGYLMVEAQIEAAERTTFDHPGDSGSIVPINVFVNGRWLDVEDLCAALDRDRLVEAIAGVVA